MTPPISSPKFPVCEDSEGHSRESARLTCEAEEPLVGPDLEGLSQGLAGIIGSGAASSVIKAAPAKNLEGALRRSGWNIVRHRDDFAPESETRQASGIDNLNSLARFFEVQSWQKSSGIAGLFKAGLFCGLSELFRGFGNQIDLLYHMDRPNF
ncbi:hypothetical protein FBR05_12670 [Deltaproteobacteria bacterium PRO3]|nr:hypothetical protein [Deltaproteobacteria bacterium PRO3]